MNEESDSPSNMREKNQQNSDKQKPTSISQTMSNSNSNGSLLTAVSTAKADLALKVNFNEKPTTIASATTNSSSSSSTTNGKLVHADSAVNSKVNVLKCDNQIKELHTVLRDKHTSHSDFKFYSDRLIRLLVEESLNVLPYSDCTVITSAGCEYNGVKHVKSICGVSIMRSGEAMEKGLRVRAYI